MIDLVNKYIGFHHFSITMLIIIPVLYIILYSNYNKLKVLLKYSLIINFSTFYLYLFYNGLFDYKIHLPLHLCYITEAAIFLSLIFKIKKIKSWLVLNATLGALVGFVNSNLTLNSLPIEYIHYYLSHFNLLLFSIIAFKSKEYISINNFYKSITINSILIVLIFIFNFLFKTNYWFTSNKPLGINLSIILPEWPYYFLILILIGLCSYTITFMLLVNNRIQR